MIAHQPRRGGGGGGEYAALLAAMAGAPLMLPYPIVPAPFAWSYGVPPPQAHAAPSAAYRHHPYYNGRAAPKR